MKAAKIVAVLLVGLVVFVSTAALVALASQRQATVGAHEATVRLALDGHVTILAGPLLPEFRTASHAPLGLGAEILLRDSPTGSLQDMLARDAAIASQPAGEVAAIAQQVRDIILDAARLAAVTAVAAMAIVVAVWKLIGGQRRSDLVDRWPPSLGSGVGWALVGSVLIVTGLMALPDPASHERQTTWVPIRTEFPELKDLPADTNQLAGVEVSRGAASSGASTLADGALLVYRQSVTFYGKLEKTAATVQGIRTPAEGETVALVVSDRHDNIAMDPVAKEIGKLGGATTLIDLGDDTSGGDPWEDFSLRSLRTTFKSWPRYWVAGNHDSGRSMTPLAKKLGFTVFNGKAITVDGVKTLGEADPRSTGLVSGYTKSPAQRAAELKAQSEQLAETACAQDVSLLVTHSIDSAQAAVDRGCVDLAIAGHLHHQVGPTVAPSGSTALTMGTTGGAVAAFALGSELRRDAQVTLLTFRDSRVAGLQIVTFHPGGTISVGEWTSIPGVTR